MIIGISGFIFGRMSASRSAGKRDGMVLTEIGYLKQGIDDIKSQNREMEKMFCEINSRVTALETSVRRNI